MLEFHLSQNSFDSLISLLGAAVIISGATGAYFLCQLCGPQWLRHAVVEGLARWILVAAATLQMLAWHLYYHSPTHTLVSTVGVIGSLIAGAVAWRIASAFTGVSVVGRWSTVVLSLMAIAQSIGFVKATELFSLRDSGEFAPLQLPQLVRDPSGMVAFTDLGTPIPLYNREVFEHDKSSLEETIKLQTQGMTTKAILRNENDIGSNCHGWTFTQGRFIVKSEDVETILRENRYQLHRRPRLGDLVVYRNDDQTISHTGIVSGFLGDGSVLVESKWGAGATYLHLPEDAPYVRNISYYRSPRGHHLLKIRERHVHELGQAIASERDSES